MRRTPLNRICCICVDLSACITDYLMNVGASCKPCGACRKHTPRVDAVVNCIPIVSNGSTRRNRKTVGKTRRFEWQNTKKSENRWGNTASRNTPCEELRNFATNRARTHTQFAKHSTKRCWLSEDPRQLVTKQTVWAPIGAFLRQWTEGSRAAQGQEHHRAVCVHLCTLYGAVTQYKQPWGQE